MDPALEEVAFALETGEVSTIVESEDGYHIIKCINTFDREQTDANKLEIVEERKHEVFGQEYDAFVEGLNRSINEKLWEQVTFLESDEVTTKSFPSGDTSRPTGKESAVILPTTFMASASTTYSADEELQAT